jgi:carbonic anhydrase
MANVTTLIQRNAEFAVTTFDSDLRIVPKLRTIIIGCVDPRVDPSDVLGLEPGETAVIRNVGGRVTAGLVEELLMLRKVTQSAGGDIGAGWEFIVLHHTDCGITRLADAPDLLAPFFGVAQAELEAKAVTDPRASVLVDIETLRAEPGLGDAIVVSGLVYDVETGLMETVAAPAPLRG